MAKTVDEKLDDIIEEISGNSLRINKLGSQLENIQNEIEDIKRLLKKIMNQTS